MLPTVAQCSMMILAGITVIIIATCNATKVCKDVNDYRRTRQYSYRCKVQAVLDQKPDTVGACINLECELGTQTTTRSAGMAVKANAVVVSITLLSMGMTSVSTSSLAFMTTGMSLYWTAAEVYAAPSVSSMVELRLDELEQKLESLAHATSKGNQTLHDKLDFSVSKYKQSLIDVKKAMKAKEDEAAKTLQSMHKGLSSKIEEDKPDLYVTMTVASQYALLAVALASMVGLFLIVKAIRRATAVRVRYRMEQAHFPDPDPPN